MCVFVFYALSLSVNVYVCVPAHESDCVCDHDNVLCVSVCSVCVRGTEGAARCPHEPSQGLDAASLLIKTGLITPGPGRSLHLGHGSARGTGQPSSQPSNPQLHNPLYASAAARGDSSEEQLHSFASSPPYSSSHGLPSQLSPKLFSYSGHCYSKVLYLLCLINVINVNKNVNILIMIGVS